MLARLVLLRSQWISRKVGADGGVWGFGGDGGDDFAFVAAVVETVFGGLVVLG